PQWHGRSERVKRMLDRHEVPVLLGFRFVYGFRSLTPLVIGATRYGALRFFIFNAIGAALWSTVVGVAGYLFGDAMKLILHDIRHYEIWLLLLLAAAGAS